jgi:hypothetical protein
MWIRSKDKTVLVETKRIIANGKCIVNQVLCQSEADDYDILGEYATKERALEVLDQIQQRLTEGHRSDVIVGATRVYRENVFEMPEE